MPNPTAFFSRGTLTAALVALVATVAAITTTGGAIFSPGALHAGDSTAVTLGGVTSHAGLAGQCGACHAAPWSAESMAARCLACHTDIQAELRQCGAARRLAARWPASAHGEHPGPTAATEWRDRRRSTPNSVPARWGACNVACRACHTHEQRRIQQGAHDLCRLPPSG
jgi:hypothetical protein